MKPKKTEQITLRIDPESKKQLEEIAEKEDRSLAYIVQTAIKEYLQKYPPQE